MADKQRQYGLLFRKKNVARQTSYSYHTASGDITLTPLSDGRLRVTSTCSEADIRSWEMDAEGVTLDLLQDLHRADNREVEANLRHAHASMTVREKEDIEAWRDDPDHPERRRDHLYPDYFQRWNFSLDSLSADENGTSPADRDPAMLHAWNVAQQEDDERGSVRSYVSTLSQRQQQVYRLHILEERTLQEAAGIMGVTHQRASAILKQLMRNLVTYFKK